jgi:hypothetical protein
MVVIFLLGWPFEWPAIVLVFVPLLQPTIIALGLDQLWFATLIAVNLQTAFLSPPVAMAAYYLKAVAPDWTLWDIYWGMAELGRIHGAADGRAGAAALLSGDRAVVSALAVRPVSGLDSTREEVYSGCTRRGFRDPNADRTVLTDL